MIKLIRKTKTDLPSTLSRAATAPAAAGTLTCVSGVIRCPACTGRGTDTRPLRIEQRDICVQAGRKNLQ